MRSIILTILSFGVAAATYSQADSANFFAAFLEEECRARARRMAPAERLAEALALGVSAVAAYACAHGIDRDEARRRLERAAQRGRRRSAVMRGIIE